MAKKNILNGDRNRENLTLLAVVLVVLVGLVAIILVGSDLNLNKNRVSGSATSASLDMFGFSDSEYVYTPYTDPDPGIYSEPVQVRLYSRTEGAVIRYTTDGSEPDEYSRVYDSPIDVYEDIDIRARAYKDGMKPSSIMLARFFIRGL